MLTVCKEERDLNILISGGTGFVGKHLTNRLINKGHHVFIITRTPQAYESTENVTYLHYDAKLLPRIHAVINLAGDSLFGYWTKRKKERILSSRINTTQTLINLMKQLPEKPQAFISASAVGFYGTSHDVIFTEKTIQPGDDFLARVVVDWEKTARQAIDAGIRTVILRLGVILGEEGALPLMSLPVKLGVGGKIGSGEQWTSWIHIDDVISLILFSLENHQLEGPINATAPHPVRNKDLIRTLAYFLKRPYWFPTPASVMRLAMGEMSELITKGQFVLPQKALDNGFTFKYPTLEAALKEISL